MGESGQQQTKGPFVKHQGEREFEKQFKSKTGFNFAERRTATPRKGKYFWLDIDCGCDEEHEREDEEEASDQYDQRDGSTHKTASDVKCLQDLTDSPKKRKSSLSPHQAPRKLSTNVQELIRLIFNEGLFDATLAELNYDAKKQPLGSLSKRNIERGLEKLTQLSEAIGKGSTNDIDTLSGAYYSLIPHIFSRSKRPLPIDNMEIVRSELDVLTSLSEMKVGFNIMNRPNNSDINRIDIRFDGLNLDKLESLDRTTTEYKRLCNLVQSSHGSTHRCFKASVGDIFTIERVNEEKIFEKSSPKNGNRVLLFHGSRLCNYAGILSEGLCIVSEMIE